MENAMTTEPSLTGLETERLTLRPFAERDIPVLPAILNDMEMCRYLALVPYPYTIKDAEWFVCQGAANALAITTKEDRLVGCMGLVPQLGYWIAKTDWRKGYATEAAAALLDRHFELSCADMIACHALENTGSARVLETLGFEQTYQKMLRIRSRNCEVPARVLKLTRAIWEARG